MITVNDIAAAALMLRNVAPPTPCRRSEVLSRWFGADVHLKLENLHITGSFKERGAYVRLMALTPEERAAGVITASAGNHAQALAYHAGRQGIRATIVMPERTPSIKVVSTRELGGQIVLHGDGFDDAYAHAVALAAERGLVFVAPFDDDLVITGQGTIGLEVLEQVPDLDTIVVPIGGGGLISGIATATKSQRPSTRVVGVEAAAYASMQASLDAGRPGSYGGGPTLADGIAVKQPCARTMAYVDRFVDELVSVDEEDIARAILVLLERQKTVAEGAAAATLAALMTGRVETRGKPTVLLLSGGNIDVGRLDDIIVRGLAIDGRRVRIRVVMPDVPGQLHRLTGVIADVGINILEVAHDREFGSAALGKTMSTLTLEARGEEHVQRLFEALEVAGFDQAERVPAATRTGGVGPVPVY